MNKIDELKTKLARQQELLLDAQFDDEKAHVQKKISQLQAEIEVIAQQQQSATKKIQSHDKLRNSCSELIQSLKEILHKYEGTQKAKKPILPVRKKRVSTIVAEGIAQTIRRAVAKESTNEKIVKIDIDYLAESEKHFIEALKSLRNALGGISSENDAFIQSFKKEIDTLISEVKEKQASLKEKA